MARYVISLGDDRFVIRSGMHNDNWGSSSSVSLYENDEEFDGSMEKFIKKFIK